MLDALYGAGFTRPDLPGQSASATEVARPAVLTRRARDLPRGVDLAVIAVPATAGPRRRRRLRGGRREVAGRDHGRLRRSRSRGARAAEQLVGEGPRLRHADGRPQLHGPAQRDAGRPAQRVVLADRAAGRGASRCRRRAARSASRSSGWPPSAGVGLSTFVSVGNKADVSGNDLLQYWEDDPHTPVILLYLESFGNPRRFARLARRIGRTKPIVAVKAGRTRRRVARRRQPHGRAGRERHRGRCALPPVRRDSRATPSTRCSTSRRASTRSRCRAVGASAIVTNAGGPGILAVDACEAAGLTVAPFSGETRDRLRRVSARRRRASAIRSTWWPRRGRTSIGAAIEVALDGRGDRRAASSSYTPVDADADPDRAAGHPRRHRGRTRCRRHRQADARVRDGRARDVPPPLDAGGERDPDLRVPGERGAGARRRSPPTPSGAPSRRPALEIRRHPRRRGTRGLPRRGRRARRRLADRRGDAARARRVRPALAPRRRSRTRPTKRRRSPHVLGFPVAAKLSAARVSAQDRRRRRAAESDERERRSARRSPTSCRAAARRRPTAAIDGVLIQPMVAGGVETMIGVTARSAVRSAGRLRPRRYPRRGAGRRALPRRAADRSRRRRAAARNPRLPAPAGISRPAAGRPRRAARAAAARVAARPTAVPEIVELDLNPVIALPPGHGCRIVDARIRVEAARRIFSRPPEPR